MNSKIKIKIYYDGIEVETFVTEDVYDYIVGNQQEEMRNAKKIKRHEELHDTEIHIDKHLLKSNSQKSFYDDLQMKQLIKKLQAEIDDLNIQEKRILYYYIFEGYSLNKIADMENIYWDKAKRILMNIIEKLGKSIKDLI